MENNNVYADQSKITLVFIPLKTNVLNVQIRVRVT